MVSRREKFNQRQENESRLVKASGDWSVSVSLRSMESDRTSMITRLTVVVIR